MVRIFARRLALCCLLLAIGTLSTSLVQARSEADRQTENSLASVRVAQLPRQGQETYEAIRKGGPFLYDKDGMVFGNRERLLPAQKRGYYREYTVTTPGSRDRGARRIVCGGPSRTPNACYYTADHYASFRQIVSEPQ